MKKLIFLLFLIFFSEVITAQTKEELEAMIASKKDSIAAIQKNVDAAQAQIDALPGWRYDAFGTIGGSFSGTKNWYSKETPNSSVGNFGIIINAKADLIREKFFWKNAANTNLSWTKLDDKDDNTDSEDFEVATDIFNLSSLYGYNLTKNFAASAFAEYRSSLINNFNDPGFLDLGVGATWTPFSDLVVVIHPLNYNFVFSSSGNSYESSLGAKIVADYKKEIGNLNIGSNLSVFLSYQDTDYSNYTWTNNLSYTIWKNLGLGFDFGLRKNKQEAYNYELKTDPNATLSGADNELQSYWLFGINYKL